VQRKVFRIEHMLAGKRSMSPAAEHRRMTDELASLRAQIGERDGRDDANSVLRLRAELSQMKNTIARTMSDLGQLIGDGRERRMARAGDELTAAVQGMETATQNILKSAECADDGAKALAAALKTDYERGLAQDIQDNVVRIYEACNFQDIAGQRIENVIATLTSIEEQVAAMLARCNGGVPAPVAAKCERDGLLNGPKLDDDTGHASQHDIDRIFG
jgi:chemotaxis protein CheZ